MAHSASSLLSKGGSDKLGSRLPSPRPHARWCPQMVQPCLQADNRGVGNSVYMVGMEDTQPQTRHHLGPKWIPTERPCRIVLKIPCGQRNNDFSKEHPSSQCAQVPYRDLQLPGHQLDRVHLILQRQSRDGQMGPLTLLSWACTDVSLIHL